MEDTRAIAWRRRFLCWIVIFFTWWSKQYYMCKPKLHIVLAASCMSQIYLKFDRRFQHGKSRDLIIMNLLISFCPFKSNIYHGHDYKLLTTSLVIWMQYIFVRYSIFLILKNPHDYIYTTDKLLVRNYGKSSYNKGHHEGI